MDLEAIARETDGYSGADLQALIYNAHLEVIHEAIPGPSDGITARVNGDNEHPGDDVKYSILGPCLQPQTVLSRAEEAAFQRRVCAITACS